MCKYYRTYIKTCFCTWFINSLMAVILSLKVGVGENTQIWVSLQCCSLSPLSSKISMEAYQKYWIRVKKSPCPPPIPLHIAPMNSIIYAKYIQLIGKIFPIKMSVVHINCHNDCMEFLWINGLCSLFFHFRLHLLLF